jgi:hypothetical protein
MMEVGWIGIVDRQCRLDRDQTQGKQSELQPSRRVLVASIHPFELQLKDIPKSINATLTYRPSNAVEDLKVHGSLSGKAIPDLAPIQYHAARLDFVTTLWTIKQKELDKSVKLLESLSESITTSPVLANHADALALEQDISGEGILALESTTYNRWGRHYLPSLARSHQRQQCGNFKDPGLQVYGSLSNVFIEERDKLDAAFMEPPPPKPSILVYTPGTGYKAAPQLKSMSKYYSSCGPCFADDCMVALPGESGRAETRDGCAGEGWMWTLTETSKVAAVLRTRVSSGESPPLPHRRAQSLTVASHCVEGHQ